MLQDIDKHKQPNAYQHMITDILAGASWSLAF